MSFSELQRKLIAAARATPPDDSVPYCFEQRIMARLTGQVAADPWSLWGRALTRAAICSVAFMLVLAAGSFFVPGTSSDSKTLLSQDVEQTLFAAVDNSPDQDTR